MNIYYEKKSKLVKFLSFLNIVIFLVLLASIALYVMQEIKMTDYYLSYHSQILYLSIGLGVFLVLLLIVNKMLNKRKNIRFDGQIIKFCVNNYVEYEFDLRKIDEIINYRTDPYITYGLHDALAFRFHKNEIWTTITSNLTNKKTKKTSIELIRNINDAYAQIKSQRAIKQMSSMQGIRFRVLTLNDENSDDDLYNEKLKELEQTFSQYSNTYGGFNISRLVITNDSLYFDKHRIASINEGDYVKVKTMHNFNENYYSSEKIEIYNKSDELIQTIDLTLVINAQLFKTLCLSVFNKVD